MFFASPQQTEALPPSLFSNGTLPSDKILLPNPSDWNSTTSSSSHLLVDTNDSRRWFLFSALEERQRSTPTFVLPRRVFLDETLGKGAYARICRTDVASVLAKVFVLSPHKPDAHTVLKDAFVECGMLHHLAETARLCDLPFSHRHIMEPLACWQVHGTRDRPVTCSVSKLAPSSSSRAVDPEVLTPVCVIFVPNGSFSAKELFANQGPVRSLVTPEQRRKLILQLPTQLMEAYRVCNAGNVVHMDIKPENIIFYKDAEHADGYVSRLIDPGIACLERTSTVRASLPYPYHPPEAWEEIDPAQKPSALDGFQVYPYPNELFDLWMIGCTTAMGLAALYLPDEHEEAAGDKSKHHTYQGKKTCSFDDLLRIIQRSRSSDSTPWTVFQSFWKERSTGHEKAYPASSVAAQTQQLEEYVTCIRNHLQRWKEDSGGKEKEKEKEERRTLSRDAERVLWTTFSSPLTRSRLFLLLNNGSDNLQKRFEENPCALPFCAPGSRSSEELNRMMAERQSPSFSFPPHGRPWKPHELETKLRDAISRSHLLSASRCSPKDLEELVSHSKSMFMGNHLSHSMRSLSSSSLEQETERLKTLLSSPKEVSELSAEEQTFIGRHLCRVQCMSHFGSFEGISKWTSLLLEHLELQHLPLFHKALRSETIPCTTSTI